MTVKAFQQANQLLREGNLEAAVVVYRQAIEQNPQFYGAYQNLGETLGKLGRLDEAVEMYRWAVQLKPDAAWSFWHLSQILQQLGQIEEAQQAWEKAAKIEPKLVGLAGNCSSIKENILEVNHANHRVDPAQKEPFDANLVKPSSLSEREIITQSSLFDESWYVTKYAQFIAQDIDPVTHYLTEGASRGFDPSPFFNTNYYFSQLSSVDKTHKNPLLHYLKYGWKKYDPNPYFSTSFYLQLYSSELNNLTPLEHYATQVPPYSFDPSPIFSSSSYLNHNQDVASVGLNPLWHYLSSGQQEDRSIKEHDDIIPYRIESTCEINSDDDVLIYVAFCPSGKLSYLQIDTVNSFVNQGYKVIVVVNSGHYSLCVHPGITKASACITRENIGYDFGAWRLACRIFLSLNKAHSITFANDSIVLLDDCKNSELLRLGINDSSANVVCLTQNTENINHLQKYFFTLKSTAIKKGALSVLINKDYYLLKNQVIGMIELDLWNKLSALGLKISEVFAHQKSVDERKNPTIHYWKELCDQGFPFLKLQLFTSGLYKLEDPEFMAVLKPSQIELIKEHLNERNEAITYYHHPDLELNSPPQSALQTPARFGDIGQLQAYNPPSSHIPSVEVPLYGIDNIKLSELSKVPILAVIHCFYVDIAAQILERISTVSSILQLQVVCTTDTSEKSTELNRLLAKYQLDGFVVITQNRGRDVAPLLIEGAKYIKDAKFILHLHTKKSPHHSKMSNWGDFLFDNLIGSKDIILSNLLLLSQGTVGLVYSEHFSEVKDLRNWGFDFNHAKEILQCLGVNLSSDMLLEFPSSTMFWARIEAIQPLFDLNLNYGDFEEESGQIDGTLAHAIERSLLYVVEHQGFNGIKVLYKFSQQKIACWKLHADELDYGLSQLRPVKLLGSSGSPSPNANAETYPVNITVSPCQRPRFNLLIPTMQPEHIYGGVSTAIKVGGELFRQLGNSVDLRLIVTSNRVDQESILEACYRLDFQFFSSRPNEDISSPTIVPFYHYRHVPLSIRSSDVFLATAWWTADLGFRLRRQQVEAFGSPQMPLIYLIQDYEPGFYTWSRRSVMARATYEEENVIALINSEELANFLTKQYSFRSAYHYPYILNETLASKLNPTQKEPMILIYGRPSVERNLFPIILEGLQMWQADNPAKNTIFKLIFAGEDFDEKLIVYLENASIVGKLSLEDYSETLNKTAIGISLMESPHPSYPPLEMASAGCVTITNGYYNKNLALRSPNILSIRPPTPLHLKSALDQATKIIDLNEITPLGNIGTIPTTVPVVNYLEIANIFKEVW
ncbi:MULTISPECIES: rhamnosyltransferase WsaF family glycosyltransferase [unclassified Microcoleus]|uniref:rhamnosyltransferase WsaF family glycosyltransferase n=1 Tax=unclassified Microcoleus TaxID=2642155 RepID=UPI002FD713FD